MIIKTRREIVDQNGQDGRETEGIIIGRIKYKGDRLRWGYMSTKIRRKN